MLALDAIRLHSHLKKWSSTQTFNLKNTLKETLNPCKLRPLNSDFFAHFLSYRKKSVNIFCQTELF